MSVRKDPNPLFKNCKKINFYWPVRTQQAMNNYSCCCWTVGLKIPTAYLSGFRVFQKGLRSDIINNFNYIIKTSPCLSYLLFSFRWICSCFVALQMVPYSSSLLIEIKSQFRSIPDQYAVYFCDCGRIFIK
jgi:hypothetical protein